MNCAHIARELHTHPRAAPHTARLSVALAVSLWRGFVGWARKAYGDWEKSITSMNERTPTAAGA